jgi:phosphatidate cytidylyltransferase
MKSNLFTRVVVAFVFAPLIIYITLLGKLPFLILIEVLIILGLWEFSRLSQAKNSEIPKIPLIILGIFLGLSAYLWGERVFLFFILGILYLSALILVIKGKTEGATSNLALSLLGFFYVAGLFSYLILLREMSPEIIPDRFSSLTTSYKIGGVWIVYLLLCIWSCDTFAYFIGAPLGKHPLSPRVSPKKTVEGFGGGILGAIAAAFFSHFVFFSSAQLKDLLIISMIVAFVGQVGDLTESLFKRDAQFKDTSNIIPGHGGILDRFDSLLFVSPLVYYYLKFVVYR